MSKDLLITEALALGRRSGSYGTPLFRIHTGHASQQLLNFKPDKGRVLEVLMATLIYISEGAFWTTSWVLGGSHWAKSASKACSQPPLGPAGWRQPSSPPCPTHSLTLPGLAPSCCLEVGPRPSPPRPPVTQWKPVATSPHPAHTHIPMASSVASWHSTHTHQASA